MSRSSILMASEERHKENAPTLESLVIESSHACFYDLHYLLSESGGDATLLLEAQPDIDPDNLLLYGAKPFLNFACEENYLETARGLIQCGASLLIPCYELLPLHYAVCRDDKSCAVLVRHLLEQPEGLEGINARARSEKTALHYAAEYAHRDVIRVLLAFGADATLLDKFGNSPRDIAEKYRSPLCGEDLLPRVLSLLPRVAPPLPRVASITTLVSNAVSAKRAERKRIRELMYRHLHGPELTDEEHQELLEAMQLPPRMSVAFLHSPPYILPLSDYFGEASPQKE